jgi:23S rRNA (uridine2552-2'-O)-methyltransferase
LSAKNKFNQAWIHAHINDPYVKLAVKEGYRARAAYKLIEIADQDHLIRAGMTVVDLGSAPGAWSQVLSRRLANPAGGVNGRIIALDLVPMEPITGIEFMQGDFREDQVLKALEDRLQGSKVDLVISDMAPNLSGVAAADSARMADLLELAVFFALDHLKPQGALLAKCFHGSGYSQTAELFKRSFVKVVARKPKSSREKSAETYLLGRVVKSDALRRPTTDDHSAD